MTKLKTKFIVAFTLVFAMLACLVAPTVATFSAYAVDAQYDTLTLGAFDTTTKKFKDATGTAYNLYASFTISLADEISGEEQIILPDVNDYSENFDLSPDYAKVIDITDDKSAKTIMEDYISQVQFKNCNQQTVSVVLNKETPTNKTAYFTENDHYYQYIKFTSENDPKTWDEAYTAARNMEYMGRQGYLATITSVEEDIYISKVTGNEVGWLGGTDLILEDKVGQYYETINVTEQSSGDHQNRWVWACGPEIGQEFFDVDIIEERDEDYRRNYEDNDYYFNWDSTEPEPNNSNEFCLTTLNRGTGYSTCDILT
ncbi:MAG: hypothetical protein MJ152_03805, partial [Clostridia bacterium]|nr:hypothetical protein [Clostridia bacterium]